MFQKNIISVSAHLTDFTVYMRTWCHSMMVSALKWVLSAGYKQSENCHEGRATDKWWQYFLTFLNMRGPPWWGWQASSYSFYIGWTEPWLACYWSPSDRATTANLPAINTRELCDLFQLTNCTFLWICQTKENDGFYQQKVNWRNYKSSWISIC